MSNLFTIDFPGASKSATRARFDRFNEAAGCAVLQARQTGECKVRLANGTLLADMRTNGGQVSVMATDVGQPYVDAWSR